MSDDTLAVKNILAQFLLVNGFDGLYTDDCGCLLEDIAPCGEFCSWDCKAGYDQHEGLATLPFHIGPTKRPAK